MIRPQHPLAPDPTPPATAERLLEAAVEQHGGAEATILTGDDAATWRRIGRATRSLAPGARVVVPALSLPHAAATGAAEPRRRAAGLAVDLDVPARAARHGLRLVDAVPYGLLLGGADVASSHLAALERTHAWRRALSWVEADPALRDLVLGLERALTPVLPLDACHRTLLVLERTRGRRGDRATLPPHRERLDLDLAVAAVGAADLAGPVRAPRARYVALALLDLAAQRLPLRPDALPGLPGLPSDLLAELVGWRDARDADEHALRVARTWAQDCAERRRHGIDLTLALDYYLVRDVLAPRFAAPVPVATGEEA